MADFCLKCAAEHGFEVDLDGLCGPGQIHGALCEGCKHDDFCVVDHTGLCLTREEMEGRPAMNYLPVLVSQDEKKRTPIDMKGVALTTLADARRWLFGDPAKMLKPGYLKTHPELDGQKMTIEMEPINREETDGKSAGAH